MSTPISPARGGDISGDSHSASPTQRPAPISPGAAGGDKPKRARLGGAAAPSPLAKNLAVEEKCAVEASASTAAQPGDEERILQTLQEMHKESKVPPLKPHDEGQLESEGGARAPTAGEAICVQCETNLAVHSMPGCGCPKKMCAHCFEILQTFSRGDGDLPNGPLGQEMSEDFCCGKIAVAVPKAVAVLDAPQYVTAQ